MKKNKFYELRVGSVLGDMHHGLRCLSDLGPYEMKAHIRIATGESQHESIERLVRGCARQDLRGGPGFYTNKELVIVHLDLADPWQVTGLTIPVDCDSEVGHLVAMYSYDGRTLGIIELYVPLWA